MRNIIPAIALLLFLWAQQACALGGMAVNPQCRPGAPVVSTQAAAFGYTCAVIDTTFGDLSSIDLSDTEASGFTWYTHNKWPLAPAEFGPFWSTGNPVGSSQYASVGGNLVYQGPTDATFGTATAAPTGNGSTYVGTALAPGFYVDYKASYQATEPSGVTNNNWPAVWAVPVEFVTGALASNAYWVELDDYEAFPNGVGSPVKPLMSINLWQITTAALSTNTNNQPTLSGDLSQLHDYGMLIVPSGDNGGTGLIHRYFDTTHLSSADCSYTSISTTCPGISPGDQLPDIEEGSHYMFIMTTGTPNWPMTVARVTVWCNPKAASCHR